MLINKRQRKLNGKSRMDNPEKLTKLGMQDTGGRQKKKNKKNTHTAQA